MNENPNEATPTTDPIAEVAAPQPSEYQPSTVIQPGQQVVPVEPTVVSPDSPLQSAAPQQPVPVYSETVQPPVPVDTMAAPASSPAPQRSRKILFATIGGIIVLVLLAAAVYLLAFSKKVTLADVHKAQSTTDSINNDLQTVNNDLGDSENADDVSTAQAKLADAKTKLKAAEDSYATLKTSPAVKDASVKAKFAAVDKEWTPYITFINDNTGDLGTIDPIIGDFEIKIKALTSTSPSTPAELTTYLASLKSLVDDLSSKTKGVNVKVDANKKIIASFQTFLTSSSQSISKAQSHLAAGDSFAAEDDLFAIDDADSTFETALSTQQTQLSDQYDKLVPNDQFSSFVAALNKLENKLQ